jgi:hypothetical protein
MFLNVLPDEDLRRHLADAPGQLIGPSGEEAETGAPCVACQFTGDTGTG